MAYSLTTINLTSAFLILVFGWALGTILANILRKILKGIQASTTLERHLKLKLKLEHTLPNTLKYLILTLILVLALTRIGIPYTYLTWAAAFVIIATLLFILLSFKDWIPNLLAWRHLSRTQRIKSGDTITIKGVEGRVVEVGLIETKIQTSNNETIFVPNILLKKTLKQ